MEVRERTLLVLLLASLVSPVGFLADNQFRGPSIWRVGLVTAVLLIAGAIILALTRIAGGRATGAPTGIAAGLIVFSNVGLAGALRATMGPTSFAILGLLLSVAVGLLVVLLVRRWPTTGDVLLWGFSATVAAPLISMVLAAAPANAVDREPRPDLVVLFLDGYAGAQSLDRIFDFDNTAFYEDLNDFGFDVAPDAMASYSMTYASIASVLDLNYVVDSGFVSERVLRPKLYRTMQGDNQLVRLMNAHGYRYVHIESGWGGTRCGAYVDRCVAQSPIDDTLWYLSQRSAVGPLMNAWYGHSFTQGALHTLEMVRTLDLDVAISELVVAHVLLPHPPLFLSDECQMEFSPSLDGLNVGAEFLSAQARELRLNAYIEQLECANRLVQSALDNPALNNAVVLVVGDHGTDTQGQLLVPNEDWTNEMIEERLNTLLAIKGCSGEPPIATINALRFAASCVLDVPYHPLPERQFLVPVFEVSPTESTIEVTGWSTSVPASITR